MVHKKYKKSSLQPVCEKHLYFRAGPYILILGGHVVAVAVMDGITVTLSVYCVVYTTGRRVLRGLRMA